MAKRTSRRRRRVTRAGRRAGLSSARRNAIESPKPRRSAPRRIDLRRNTPQPRRNERYPFGSLTAGPAVRLASGGLPRSSGRVGGCLKATPRLHRHRHAIPTITESRRARLRTRSPAAMPTSTGKWHKPMTTVRVATTPHATRMAPSASPIKRQRFYGPDRHLDRHRRKRKSHPCLARPLGQSLSHDLEHPLYDLLNRDARGVDEIGIGGAAQR